MLAATLLIGAIVLLVVLLAFAFGPVIRAHINEALPAFIAFFLLLLGLRMVFTSAGPEGNILLGDFLASLALTYFYVNRTRPRH